jgi:hypothetical protein
LKLIGIVKIKIEALFDFRKLHVTFFWKGNDMQICRTEV